VIGHIDAAHLKLPALFFGHTAQCVVKIFGSDKKRAGEYNPVFQMASQAIFADRTQVLLVGQQRGVAPAVVDDPALLIGQCVFKNTIALQGFEIFLGQIGMKAFLGDHVVQDVGGDLVLQRAIVDHALNADMVIDFAFHDAGFVQLHKPIDQHFGRSVKAFGERFRSADFFDQIAIRRGYAALGDQFPVEVILGMPQVQTIGDRVAQRPDADLQRTIVLDQRADVQTDHVISGVDRGARSYVQWVI